YGGNPALGRVGPVRVSYRFTGLSGTAAFHVYALRMNSDQFMTNRQEGYSRSAYYVNGNAAPSDRISDAVPLPSPNRVAIVIANPPQNSTPGMDDTYMLRFDKGPDSGLDSLHITQDPSDRTGQVIHTTEQEGEFLVTHTGGSRVSALLLMVAVDRMQPPGFSLDIRSEFVGEGR
ncbi:MAG: hypothetical protein LUQ25_04300, partial [Methanoregulaceae archaeon]|nr:hypothetical protein [Methanoregulaceae archaeon]